MTVNVNEAVVRIKQAGAENVRCVPMSGQNVNTGMYQIEICEGGSWSTVATGMTKQTAEGIISQAVNKVILG